MKAYIYYPTIAGIAVGESAIAATNMHNKLSKQLKGLKK